MKASEERVQGSVWWGGLFLLVVNGVFLAASNWGKCGHPRVDSYQSTYVLSAVARGETPYLDFSYFFGPFSLYTLGLPMRWLGVHLDVLYWAGMLNVAIGCFLVGLLLSELRVSSSVILGALFLFLNGFGFNNVGHSGLFNYVLPYCHSSVHAVLFLLASVVCLLRWQRNTGTLSLIFWALLGAGVTLNRPVLGSVFLLLSLLMATWVGGRKPALTLAACWVSPTLLIYGYFAIVSGLEVLLWDNLFWTGHLPQNNVHQQWIFFRTTGDLVALLRVAAARLVPLVLLLLYQRRNRSGWMSDVLLSSLAVALFHLSTSPTELFLDCQILVLICLAWNFIRRKQMLFVNVLALVLLLRILFRLQLDSYFFYLGLLPLLVVVATAADCWKQQRVLQLYLLLTLLSIGLRWGLTNYEHTQTRTLELATPRGTIWLYHSGTDDAMVETVVALNEVGIAGERLLVVPEGALINFLTESRHPNYHSTLLPHLLENVGEEVILEGLQADPPRHLVTLHRYAGAFGKSKLFGSDYGLQISNWISTHYRTEASFGLPPFEAAKYGAGGAVLYRLEGER